MSNWFYNELRAFDDLGKKQLNDTLRALWGKVMGNVNYKDLSKEAKEKLLLEASGQITLAVGEVVTNVEGYVDSAITGVEGYVNDAIDAIPPDVDMSDTQKLLDTAFVDRTKWTTVGGTYVTLDTTVLHKGRNTLKLSRSGATANEYIQGNQLFYSGGWWNVGDVITLSGYAKSSDPAGLDEGAVLEFAFENSTTTSYYNAIINSTNLIANEWKQFKLTMPIPAGTIRVGAGLLLKRNGTIWFGSPKLEIGSEPTIWTPHALDPAQRITATAVKITPENGIRVDQYFAGATSVGFYTLMSASKFGVYKASNNAVVAEAGADADGTGYFAVNRLKDPQISTGFHIALYSAEGRIGLKMIETIAGVQYDRGTIGYEYAAESAQGTSLRKALCGVTVGTGPESDGSSLVSESDTEFCGLMQLGGIEGTYAGSGAEWLYYLKDFFDTNRARHYIEVPTVVGETMTVCAAAGIESTGDTDGKTARLLARALDPGTSGRGALFTKGWLIPDDTGVDDMGYGSKRYRKAYFTQSPDVSSDARTKRDIRDIDVAYAFVMALRPRMYALNSDPDGAPAHMGFIAQEVLEAAQAASTGPTRVVSVGDDGMYGMVYEELIAPLVGAVQQQQKKISELEDRLSRIEALLQGGNIA